MPEKSLIEEFVCEYGSQSARLLVASFVRQAPAFKGDEDIARELGVMMGKLEAALQEVWDKMVAENRA